MERLHYHILDEKKVQSGSKKGLVIEAHPDDAALGEGIIETLAQNDVLLTGLTLTDGGNRRIKGHTRESLIQARREESKNSLGISGVGDVYHAHVPDGRLIEHSDEGIAIVKEVLDTKQPDFIIVTHKDDVHPDHASAGEIVLAAGGEEIPIYFMDTPTAFDRFGEPLSISHAFSLTSDIVQQRNDAYFAHRSQVTQLPDAEMEDVMRVVRLPAQRGKEYGVAQAGVLFHANPHTPDIFTELMGNRIDQRKYKKAA